VRAFLAGSALVKPTLFRNAVNKHLIRFNLVPGPLHLETRIASTHKVTIAKLNAGNEVFQKDNENR
jgi:hypothetical protein